MLQLVAELKLFPSHKTLWVSLSCLSWLSRCHLDLSSVRIVLWLSDSPKETNRQACRSHVSEMQILDFFRYWQEDRLWERILASSWTETFLSFRHFRQDFSVDVISLEETAGGILQKSKDLSQDIVTASLVLWFLCSTWSLNVYITCSH